MGVVDKTGLWATRVAKLEEQVVAGDGTVAGPFELDGASSVHYFETDFSARRLRSEVVKSTGGNTGAVEIEVYGEPSR